MLRELYKVAGFLRFDISFNYFQDLKALTNNGRYSILIFKKYWTHTLMNQWINYCTKVIL